MIISLLTQLGGGLQESYFRGTYRVRKYKSWTFGDVRGIKIVGKFLFVLKEDGVKVLNLANLKDSLSGIKLPEYITRERPTDVQYYKGTMYVAYNTRMAPSVDIVSFQKSDLMNSLTSGGSIISLEIGGNFLFVLTSLGLELYDLTNPSDPQDAGSVPFSGFSALNMRVVYPYIYLATGQNGLIIFKVEGGKISKVYEYKPPDGSPVLDVEPYGNYAYLACSKGGIKVINVSNRDNPLVGEVDTEQPVFALRRYQKHLIGFFGRNGFKMYSLANPTSPLLEAYYSNGQYVYDAGIYGEYIAAAFGNGGVVTFVSPSLR